MKHKIKEIKNIESDSLENTYKELKPIYKHKYDKSLYGLENTYKELKHSFSTSDFAFLKRLENTYKELKL